MGVCTPESLTRLSGTLGQTHPPACSSPLTWCLLANRRKPIRSLPVWLSVNFALSFHLTCLLAGLAKTKEVLSATTFIAVGSRAPCSNSHRSRTKLWREQNIRVIQHNLSVDSGTQCLNTTRRRRLCFLIERLTFILLPLLGSKWMSHQSNTKVTQKQNCGTL